MITVQHLCKRFGDLTVLKDVSAEIQKGEVISIIGPSGTGKSTFLRCLNLLERPTSGSIRINGADLLAGDTDVPKLRQRMNMVFQSFNLFSHLTALDNLTFGPIHLRRMGRAQAERKAFEILRLVGLAEKAGSFPDELSGGQKQRVAIARCLAMEPEIILLDEPTSALDPTTVSEVLAVIRRLARDGMTMMIVTHEMDFARDVSTRVLYMDEGVIYEEGPPQQIFGQPAREKTRAFIQRIRGHTHRITSPDYDLYALNAEIEAFCDKHILPRQLREELLLVVEEVLQMYAPLLKTTALDLAIAYSERTRELELTWESGGEPVDPLAPERLPDELGLSIVRNLTKDITWQRLGDRNRVHMRMRRA
jgi:polar amino acid transport system ATP-binding protein